MPTNNGRTNSLELFNFIVKVFSRVCLRFLTWRGDLRDPVAPQTHGPSSTLRYPDMAARLQPPLAPQPGSDKITCGHQTAVAVETLKEKYVISWKHPLSRTVLTN